MNAFPVRRATLAMGLGHRFLRCPKCDTAMDHELMMGISVEKCPSCRGLFFDEGEAELLVRRHLRLRGFRRFWGRFTTSIKTN